jgi:hypothetical protein
MGLLWLSGVKPGHVAISLERPQNSANPARSYFIRMITQFFFGRSGRGQDSIRASTPQCQT